MASPALGKLVWSGKLRMSCLLVVFFSSFIRCDEIEGEIRLVDGYSSDEGRVEIFHESQWGTVCNDSWDDLDARVVCRQLGYSGNVGVARRGGTYGQGSDPIYLDDVGCSGSESRLTDCSNGGWGIHNCEHYDDAGVYCGDSSTQPPQTKSSHEMSILASIGALAIIIVICWIFCRSRRAVIID